MPNQHKPIPPEVDLKPVLEFYYHIGLSDIKIASHCLNHFDKEVYGLGVISVRRLRKKWGLRSTRQQQHTVASIAEHVAEIKTRFPGGGADSVKKTLLFERNIRVPRDIVAAYLKQTEPEAVNARRQRRFKRRCFWAAGVNDVWAIDQHDKWKRFGLFLHVGVDPFPGFILWNKIWWTNSNPRLITSYYIEVARKQNGIPLVTQSDPGSENFGVANAHTNVRHRLDASLAGTLQHRWMRKHQNIKPEIHWSLLRRTWTPGFENMLDNGVENGWYDIGNPLHELLFRWLAIPWLQRELDAWVYQRNMTARRADKNKILPQGVPELIRQNPPAYGCQDFKVSVPNDVFDEIERTWAPPDHNVFKLVPEEFAARVGACYGLMNEPVISSGTFWNIYRQMLAALEAMPLDASFQQMLDDHVSYSEGQMQEQESVPVISGLQDLVDDRVVGVGRDPIDRDSDEEVYAIFTDTESDGEHAEENSNIF
ncbi:hypothetical protein HETIRDRAFT_326132 [Heterobasidion irregulare TC 32-1]|uniref:Integrase core domain-containing protein n=1 Tax=Heterobasidion irregulare (strain TC 32-1) TaxID=747525 RepID=W4JY99_HETIT|nr:uncharacterized protein HETIRDRAFT_326132 [Heterobasidion irregulare TC 32-1]ETW77826.1 hypothetical protein HETIRDRAFT_326132 [Heterobasidion irregulare TC 32-1]